MCLQRLSAHSPPTHSLVHGVQRIGHACTPARSPRPLLARHSIQEGFYFQGQTKYPFAHVLRLRLPCIDTQTPTGQTQRAATKAGGRFGPRDSHFLRYRVLAFCHARLGLWGARSGPDAVRQGDCSRMPQAQRCGMQGVRCSARNDHHAQVPDARPGRQCLRFTPSQRHGIDLPYACRPGRELEPHTRARSGISCGSGGACLGC